MKKIIFLLLMVFSTLCAKAQCEFSTCRYYDGFWGEWETHSSLGFWKLYGNYDRIFLYLNGRHPSEYVFGFTINNYVEPSKKEIKQHLKENVWWEYNGKVEYYITDDYNDIKAFLKQGTWVWPWEHDVSAGDRPCVKRTVPAKIKIAPYKDHPKVYNIWFENVAYAIDLGTCVFR